MLVKSVHSDLTVVIVQINMVFCVIRNREMVKTAEVDVLDEAAEGNPEQNLKYA